MIAVSGVDVDIQCFFRIVSNNMAIGITGVHGKTSGIIVFWGISEPDHIRLDIY